MRIVHFYGTTRCADRLRFLTQGVEPLTSSSHEFVARIDREIANWHKVAKAANIRVE